MLLPLSLSKEIFLLTLLNKGVLFKYCTLYSCSDRDELSDEHYLGGVASICVGVEHPRHRHLFWG